MGLGFHSRVSSGHHEQTRRQSQGKKDTRLHLMGLHATDMPSGPKLQGECNPALPCPGNNELHGLEEVQRAPSLLCSCPLSFPVHFGLLTSLLPWVVGTHCWCHIHGDLLSCALSGLCLWALEALEFGVALVLGQARLALCEGCTCYGVLLSFCSQTVLEFSEGSSYF